MFRLILKLSNDVDVLKIYEENASNHVARSENANSTIPIIQTNNIFHVQA